MKICPRLQKAGFLKRNGSLRSGKNWIETICCYCPLDKAKGYCVYDKPEAISAEEICLLLGGEGEDISDN